MADPALEQAVRRLVGRLGADSFRTRESATRALIRLGEPVLPVLDKIPVSEDPEVRVRLECVRYAIEGWKHELAGVMASLGRVGVTPQPEALGRAGTLVRGNQPRSGDWLLGILAKPGSPLRSGAIAAFALGWDTMSAGQVERYLRAGLRPIAIARPRYPQGVPAMIRMQYNLAWDWRGLPADYRKRPPGKELEISTTTTHYLDGKVYGKPYVYRYPSPGACTGWVRVGELARGRHTLRLVTEFSLNHRGKRVRVTAGSKAYSFEVAAADTPDDLAAERTAELDELVKRSLRFSGLQSDRNRRLLLRRRDGLGNQPTPQVTSYRGGVMRFSLHLPTWVLADPLPVDLCFDVELEEVDTGKRHVAAPLVVLAGRKTEGYFMPRDTTAFAGKRAGDVTLRVLLKPSRATAMTNTDVKRYYTGPISSQPVKARIERP